MNALETKLRTAFEQTAREISPRDVPELRPPGPAGSRRAVRLPAPRRWPDWAAPLLAAGVVVAVIAVSLVVPGAVLGGHAGHRGAGSQAAALAGVPSYYVMLSYANPRLPQSGGAYVRAATTGRVITAVHAPAHGTFTAITGAANDRTFVLAARVRPGVKSNNSRMTELLPSKLQFYRLSINPPSRRTSLAPVQVPVARTATLTGLALTPDASKLAVSLAVGYRSVINVVSMVTGRIHRWSGQTPGSRNEAPGNTVKGLSWAADDRTLAYGNLFNVRLLDTEAPGNSLALDSASRVAATGKGLRVPMACTSLRYGAYPAGYWGNALLTSDASLVIASGGYRNGRAAAATIPRKLWQGGTMTYPCSAPAWHAVRARLRTARYGTLTGAIRWIYWAGPSGRTLIVHAYFGLGGRGITGVLNGDRFTPVPGAEALSADPGAAISSVAW